MFRQTGGINASRSLLKNEELSRTGGLFLSSEKPVPAREAFSRPRSRRYGDALSDLQYVCQGCRMFGVFDSTDQHLVWVGKDTAVRNEISCTVRWLGVQYLLTMYEDGQRLPGCRLGPS